MHFLHRKIKHSASFRDFCVLAWRELKCWSRVEKLALKHVILVTLLSSWPPCAVALWEKGGIWCISVHVRACLYVKHFSVLYSFTAVISAHPIHSLDNPHHHFHSGSLASPTRSYLHHQVNPWPIGTSMSHSDRANSTGEISMIR